MAQPPHPKRFPRSRRDQSRTQVAAAQDGLTIGASRSNQTTCPKLQALPGLRDPRAAPRIQGRRTAADGGVEKQKHTPSHHTGSGSPTTDSPTQTRPHSPAQRRHTHADAQRRRTTQTHPRQTHPRQTHPRIRSTQTRPRQTHKTDVPNTVAHVRTNWRWLCCEPAGPPITRLPPMGACVAGLTAVEHATPCHSIHIITRVVAGVEYSWNDYFSHERRGTFLGPYVDLVWTSFGQLAPLVGAVLS